jgi:alpha-glucoside transport system permease protein
MRISPPTIFVKTLDKAAMSRILRFVLWIWNDLLIALVYLGTNEEVAVLPARLSELVGTKGEAWHLLTAGAFVTMVVPLLGFLLLQRSFVRGIVTGSVKG